MLSSIHGRLTGSMDSRARHRLRTENFSAWLSGSRFLEVPIIAFIGWVVCSPVLYAQSAAEIVDDVSLIEASPWKENIRKSVVSKIGDPYKYEMIIVCPETSLPWVLGFRVVRDGTKKANEKYLVSFYELGEEKVIQKQIAKKQFDSLTRQGSKILYGSDRAISFKLRNFPQVYYLFCRQKMGALDGGNFMSGYISNPSKGSLTEKFCSNIRSLLKKEIIGDLPEDGINFPE